MIKVCIIDYSPVISSMISDTLSVHTEYQVIGVFSDPAAAKVAINIHHPDVVILDITIPRLDGAAFIRELLSKYQINIILTSLAMDKYRPLIVRGLQAGALDYVTKPDHVRTEQTAAFKSAIYTKVQMASAASSAALPLQSHITSPIAIRNGVCETSCRLIAIGASTGGPNAIRLILEALPGGLPPMVIAIHMPADFVGVFADQLNQSTPHHVHIAAADMHFETGHIYIAPGDHHMEVITDHNGLRPSIHQGPKVNGHRPSVDVLMTSLASADPTHTIGIILTGMGDDGANGLKKLRDAGAITIGQNETGCLVYGMPKIAYEIGAVTYHMPLTDIATKIVRCLEL